VDSEALKQAMLSETPPLLLDVRTPKEFAQGHLRDALSMPSDSVEARIKELEPYRDRTIVVYCEVGVKSLRVSKLLLSKGFDHVLHYQGGMRAWKGAKGEIVK
jgi:rhodanese-related sulfurtransferase